MLPIEATLWDTRWRSSAVILWLAIVVDFSGVGSCSHALGAERDEPWLAPYSGPTRSDVDATTLDGKVLCGYQGWFNTPGDGTNFGFTHWGTDLTQPQRRHFTVDMWPDTSEYSPSDLCAVSGLKMPDGSAARLYSAFRKGPVLLHCRWMRQYGIDGVFLSRFVSETTRAGAACEHGARQRARGMSSRGASLGADARPVDGTPGVDGGRHQ